MWSLLQKDRHLWIALLAAFPVWAFFYFFANKFSLAPVSLQTAMLVIFVFPILEELSFRGAIQSYFIKRLLFQKVFFSLSYANIVTSLLFVSLHLIYQPVLLALLVFFPSLVFGYFRDRYHNVLPSTILHMFYNAGWVGMLMLIA